MKLNYATVVLGILAVLWAAVSPPVGLFVGFAAVVVEIDSRLAKRNGW